MNVIIQTSEEKSMPVLTVFLWERTVRRWISTSICLEMLWWALIRHGMILQWRQRQVPALLKRWRTVLIWMRKETNIMKWMWRMRTVLRIRCLKVTYISLISSIGITIMISTIRRIIPRNDWTPYSVHCNSDIRIWYISILPLVTTGLPRWRLQKVWVSFILR